MTPEIERVPFMIVRYRWEVDHHCGGWSAGGWSATKWGARRAARKALKEHSA